MDDKLVSKLIDELAETRKSFNAAIGSIKWNRRNTIIQYCLILVVFAMLVSGLFYYWNERRETCQSLDDNASAIGVALAHVSGASPETFEEYMTVYRGQDKAC